MGLALLRQRAPEYAQCGTPRTSAAGPEEDRRRLVAEQRELERQRRKLEADLAWARSVAMASEQAGPDRVHGLSHDELRRLAENCEVRMDQPGAMPEKLANELRLTEPERRAYEDALTEVRAQVSRETDAILRPLMTGRDPRSIDFEERLKILFASRLEEDPGLMRKIAAERAGMRPAPDDNARMSPYERWERLRASAGDRMEVALASRIGGPRAVEIRAARNGWPGRKIWYQGCG